MKFKKEINALSVLINIIISGILISILTWVQTSISRQQLEIAERQVEIVEYQNLISEFEHSPYFDFYTYNEELNDVNGKYLTESILIENKGYPILDYETTIYSFFEFSKRKYPFDTLKFIADTVLLPVKFYFSTGNIHYNHKGILSEYYEQYNYVKYEELEKLMFSYNETFDWKLNKFHIVKIEYVNFKGNRQFAYLCDRKRKMNKSISSEKATKYINLHENIDVIAFYDLNLPHILSLLNIDNLTSIKN